MWNRNMLFGIGVGALVAYVADPRTGRRRRALARDQIVRASRKTRDALDATARDLANRTSGIIAATQTRWAEESVDDSRLIERVRATLGRACSHPRAIDVEARNGSVTLRGPILASEVDNLLATIRGVAGVQDVVSALTTHESADGISSLQGDGHTADASLDILQRRWAPATRALVTAAGLAATGICVAAYSRR